MTIDRAHIVWTYDDVRQMPEDGLRYEVLDGDLVVNPSPSTTHQMVSGLIHFELMLQIQKRGVGRVFHAPTDLIFSTTRVLVPDLLVVSMERAACINERGIEGPPDLAIEILSPSTETTDRTRKAKIYADEGVREYWIVDPKLQSVEVYSLSASSYELTGTYTAGSRVLSRVFDLDLPIERIFKT